MLGGTRFTFLEASKGNNDEFIPLFYVGDKNTLALKPVGGPYYRSAYERGEENNKESGGEFH